MAITTGIEPQEQVIHLKVSRETYDMLAGDISEDHRTLWSMTEKHSN